MVLLRLWRGLAVIESGDANTGLAIYLVEHGMPFQNSWTTAKRDDDNARCSEPHSHETHRLRQSIGIQ